MNLSELTISWNEKPITQEQLENMRVYQLVGCTIKGSPENLIVRRVTKRACTINYLGPRPPGTTPTLHNKDEPAISALERFYKVNEGIMKNSGHYTPPLIANQNRALAGGLD